MKQTYLVALCLAAMMASTIGADETEETVIDSADERMQHWLSHPQRTAHAIRANQPPILDGRVEVAEWAAAPLQTGFTQGDPDQGEPATQKTTFQILYD
ncbi:MAG: hypothetical protein HOB49_09635, partial [Gemmatimonadetes bacterium]|nr:hypothetical protein [Gemmatimonadota bacterium]